MTPFASLAVILLSLTSPTSPDVGASLAAPPAARAEIPSAHVEGPHLMIDDDSVIALWSQGDERHVERLARADTVDIPAWRGTPAMPGVPLAPPTVGPSVFAAPDRMFVLGDVHGRYEPFAAVLRHAGVIDDEDRWTFGTGHLVCCGDLMDRGAGVAQALWLLHRLEREAAAQGGAVHVLLGNHELMVIQDDLRYLHPDLVGVADVIGVPYPALYGPDTVLGRWLRTRHAVIRIGDLAFAHGGIGPALLELATDRGFDHDDINRLVRAHLDDSKAEHDADPFLDALFGSPGPLWYRGYFIEDQERYDPASDADIDRALAWLGARAIVVAHTQFDRVGTHREGRVIATDVNLEQTAEAVLIVDEAMFRVRVGGEPAPLTPLPVDGES